MVVAGGWGEGEVSRYYLKGIEVQFHKLQKVLEMDHGDIMGLYLMPKNCIFLLKQQILRYACFTAIFKSNVFLNVKAILHLIITFNYYIIKIDVITLRQREGNSPAVGFRVISI